MTKEERAKKSLTNKDKNKIQKPNRRLQVHIFKNHYDKNENYCEVQTTIDKKVRINQEIVLMGDFNARIEDETKPGIKQRFYEIIRDDNGERMVDFLTTNELR